MSIENDIKQKTFKNLYNKVTVNIMFTSGWLTNSYAKILKPYNLTEQQYNVLEILQKCYPQVATVNYIIEGMIERMSNASRLVDKLVLKGLVEKVKSKYDLRSVDVILTEKGITLLDKLSKVIYEHEISTHTLDDNEINILNALLEKLKQ